VARGVVRAVALICIVTFGCSPKGGDPAQDAGAAARSKAQIESVYTDLTAGSCRKEIDITDPNETPYLLCPGVAGYSLIVRRVDAGRRSIDVVDPAQRVLPLQFHELVTRSMSTLADRAEWRVSASDGKQVPVSLIVRVQARENNDKPEQVTGTILAVVKIARNEACVTDRIPDSAQSEIEARRAADAARDRPCVQPLPPVTVDGAVVR
jgi:hypothetical protein